MSSIATAGFSGSTHARTGSCTTDSKNVMMASMRNHGQKMEKPQVMNWLKGLEKKYV